MVLCLLPQGGITGDAYGVVPYGDGWYRAYITTTFGFGFSSLRGSIILNNATGAQSWTGDGNVLEHLSGVLNSIRVLLILTPQ